jgi:tetratricopeptide (TPR) repeat protein
MTRLFISHATKDDNTINLLHTHLTDAGIETWIDHKEGIPVGENWDATIRKAINGCDACVFVMSESSLASEICSAECLLARELKKTIYILKWGEVKPESIWLFIKMAQYAEIGADMGAAVARLLRALRGEHAADLPAAVVAPITGGAQMRHTLPYLDNPLRGRDADVAAVIGMLGGAAVQIVGTGGLGKSRLAAEIARAHGSGAVWHRCGRADDVIPLLVQHLALADTTTRTGALAKLASAERKPLFILDNGEDILPHTPERTAYTALIAELLHAGAPLLLTTRVVWDDLKPRREYTPAALDADVGAQIATDFAASEGIDLSANDARRLADAARLHPRLIEKAVDLLHERGLDKVIALLGNLKHYAIEDALDEMITRTVEQMRAARGGENAYDGLRRLTLFSGSYDTAAALALLPDGDADALDDALALLYKYRFVRRDGERWRTDTLARVVVGKRLDAAEYEALFARYADVYIERARDFVRLQPQDWAALADDLEDITALGDALVTRTATGTAGDLRRAHDFAYPIADYLNRRREVQRVEWIEMGLNAARILGEYEDTRSAQARFLGQLGLMHSAWSDKRKALGYYEEGLALRRAMGDSVGEASALNNIGAVWASVGDKQQALAYYEQALPLLRDANKPNQEAITLNNIGVIWSDMGEQRKALAYYEQVLALRRDTHDMDGMATTLNNIGAAWDSLGDSQKALEQYEQALSHARAVGNRGLEATILNNIGDIHAQRGETQTALSYYEQTLPLRRIVGDRNGEALTHTSIARLYNDMGDQRRAISHYEEALALFRTLDNPSQVGQTLNPMGLLYAALGEREQAIGLYNEALLFLRAGGDRHNEAHALGNLGASWYALGDPTQALVYYQQALALHRANGNRVGEATALSNIAVLYQKQGDNERAVETLLQTLALVEQSGERGQWVLLRYNLGYTLAQLGRSNEAAEHLRAGLALLRDGVKPTNSALTADLFESVLATIEP